MLELIIVLLIILVLLGYIDITGITIPDFILFQLNGQPITLWNIFAFLLILWAIGILPSPFREIAGVLLLLWILSVLGILAVAGLSSLIIIAIVVGLIVSLFQSRSAV